nr:HYR domain-containing protein [Phaeodactylibacter luteus]
MKNINFILLAIFAFWLSRPDCALAQCDPSCSPTGTLNFSTGWDPVASTTIGLGQIDPHWRLMNVPPISGAVPPGAAVPTPPDAYAIPPLNGFWNVLSGSRVLSMTNQNNFGPNNLNPAQPWRFRRYFCLCQDAEVVLEGDIKADDTGGLALYNSSGVPMGFSAALAPAPNTSNFNTGVSFAQALFLPAGGYYFEFELLNTNGVATGFAVEGLMTSANGLVINDEQSACCAAAAITGQKLLDLNANGVFDPGTDQAGPGFFFDLIDQATGMVIATAQSDAFGEFEFGNLPPGNYTVREQVQWGWLSFAQSYTINLGANDAQHVTFLNLPYTPTVWLDCTFGGIQPEPDNDDDERGLAITTDGGFFGSNTVRTFSTTNLLAGPNPNDKIVSKSWDNGSGALQPVGKINYFTDVDPGGHFVDNMHVLNVPSFCNPQSRFAAVGTVRNASNSDVFYAEFAPNGSMLSYVDVTSTPGFEREHVNDFISLSSGELMWAGYKITPPQAGGARRRVMVSKFDNCNGPSFQHREYEIQTAAGVQQAEAASVIELIAPLPGQPNAKYVVTGQAGREVFLLFLGANLNPVGSALTYDVDSNPSTSEGGVRIRRNGDDLFIVGNGADFTGILGSSDERIFLLKLRFQGQQGIPQASAYLYNLPGLGEQVVDMELNSSGELILTGVCDFADPLGVSGNPETQQTFLMALDEFGNQLWGKKVAFSEGSAPTDLHLSQLLDEINVTGSCWVNEFGGTPFPFNSRRFDELTIRASRYGELIYNTGCTEPLAAQVVSPTPFPQDFLATAITPSYSFVPGTQVSGDYFVERMPCAIGNGGDVECDSLLLTAQQLADTSGNCCYSLQYQNNSPAPVYELCVRIGGGSSATFVNVSAVPGLIASLASSGREINIRSSATTALPAGALAGAVGFCLSGASAATLNYLWKDVNGNVICEQAETVECSNCTADFTWSSDCCGLQLAGSATGTGPYLYEWDFLCDGTIDATGATVALSNLPVGPNVLCLAVTDASGCTATVQQTVTVAGDDTPPVINCPADITLPTDPGACFASYTFPPLTATDDCDEELTVSCFLTGATTTPIAPVTALNKGVTTVNCATEDDKGNLGTCTYIITVEDNEPPTITCPAPPPVVTVPACDGGAVASFGQPVFGDNCPMASISSSHQSGGFFPCGTTTVTYTATDMAGNETACSFPVQVDCSCAEAGGQILECTDVDNQYLFTAQVNVLNNAGAGNCTIDLLSGNPAVIINSGSVTITGTYPNFTVTALVDIAGPPVPQVVSLQVVVSCVCDSGEVSECTFPLNTAVPCCKQIFIDPDEVCKTGGAVQVPLGGCSSLYDVQQVRWYVADAPCPAVPFGTPPILVTNSCSDLTLLPQYHDTDVCVYAEVDMGPAAGACTTLRTAPVVISLCEGVGCTLPGDEFCYTGTPITPSLLTASLPPTDCAYTIQWYDNNGPIPGETGPTYQPGPISLPAGSTACFVDFTYRAVISSVCGDQECSATIRLYNEDAPDGALALLPPDTNPLCYGEDAVLAYEPACAGEPERWTWHKRTATTAYAPITTNGDRSPVYYTNRLYEDTWIKVIKQNGICPEDEVELMLDIIDPLVVNSFSADYFTVCAPTTVELQVDFQPSFQPGDGCDYAITWYRDGNPIGSSNQLGSPANFTYTPADGIVSGYYYAVVESSCCPQRVKSPVVVKDPPMEVLVAGPCFRCNCDTVNLEGIVRFPIPGFSCTYQWYDNGVPIAGETGAQLTVDPILDGPFTFEVTCTDGATTCVQSEDFVLMQCGSKEECTAPFCEGNLVQNGDFEQGTASGSDEDIANALHWGGIWGNAGAGFSSADLYSDVALPPFASPLPLSQGQFAGFWSRIQGGDAFREGVLNELNATIMPNTGVYELTFKIACLFTPPGPASMSIYVANGGINGGAPLLDGVTPTNDNLFADSWEIVAHPLTTSCDNNFQAYTYTMDTNDPAFPPSGINAIFFTRTDGVQPGAYVALDDVCLRSICCQDEQAFDTALNAFQIVQNGNESQVAVNHTDLNGCYKVAIDWGDGQTDIIWPDFAVNATHNYGFSGDYDLQITLEEYGSDGLVCFDGIFNGGSVTGASRLESGNEVRLFPNPASEEVQLAWDDQGAFSQLLLRDVTGARLWAESIPAGAVQMALDLRELPSGVYWVQLFTPEGRLVVRKVIKQ